MRSIRPYLIAAAIAASIAALLAPPWVSAQEKGASAAAIEEIAVMTLPLEARQTLKVIKRGGPYPYLRDAEVFGNYERLLPRRDRGYYREYTVPTPDAKDRAERRIIAGRSGEYYYTEDRYRSIRRIRE